MKAIELLATFIDEQMRGVWPHNAWLNGDDMAVYVRKSVPRILNEATRCVTLDIGSVIVYDKNKGQFTRFLAEAEKLNPWPALFVESVQEARFGRFLLKQGYTQIAHMFPASFYKMTLLTSNQQSVKLNN